MPNLSDLKVCEEGPGLCFCVKRNITRFHSNKQIDIHTDLPHAVHKHSHRPQQPYLPTSYLPAVSQPFPQCLRGPPSFLSSRCALAFLFPPEFASPN